MRRAMRIKGKIKRWLYGSVPGYSGRFPYFGTTVYFPKGSHLFDRVCAAGIYELDILTLLRKLIEPQSYYFDVGANIGLMSVPILKDIPGCHVISFEPSPNALPYLLRTLSESDYRDRWTVVGQALGGASADTQFCINEPGLGAFDGIQDTHRVKSKSTISVSMTTLDLVWREIGKPKVSMIKIDVEGSELEVLKGATDCLQQDKPFVLLEWNSTNLKANRVDPYLLLDFAQTHDYAIFSVNELLLPVVNRATLHLQMLLGIENFIMVPNGNTLP